MTAPTLTWRDCPSGRKVAMLGEHEVGYITTITDWRGTAYGYFTLGVLLAGGRMVTPPRGHPSNQQACVAVERAFDTWWQKAGLA